MTPRKLSLSDCLQLALEHNLDVKVARIDPEIARENLDVARGVYEPALEAGAARSSDKDVEGAGGTKDNAYRASITGLLPTGMTVEAGGELSTQNEFPDGGSFGNAASAAAIQVRQPLLKNAWIDAPRLAIQVARKQWQISELSLQERIMRVVTDVQLAYYDLLLARERVHVQAQALQLAERLAMESQKRVEAGTLARLDEKQAESQVAARQADLFGAQGALAAQEYLLKNLLTADLGAWERVRIEPADKLSAATSELDLHRSWGYGLTKRPEILQMRVDLERQGVVLKYLHNQIFPQLDLVASYGLSGTGLDSRGAWSDVRRAEAPSYTFGVALSFPLGGNRSARASYRANKAELDQSLLRLKRLEQDVMVEIGISVEQARTRFAQVGATRQARLFAEAALEAEQKKLDHGRSTGFVVLQLQRDLTTARLAELTAVADYNRALAQLALREGTTLERHRLGLSIR